MKAPPPSDAGVNRASELAKEFSDDLIDEAGRIAHRLGAEEASAKHVEEAANRLYRRTSSRRHQIASTVGGLLLGGGASSLVSVLIDDEVHRGLIGGSASVTALGAMVLMYGLVGDR